MKLKIVRKAIEDEPELPASGLHIAVASASEEALVRETCMQVVRLTKASILARIEEYRKNPPIK